MIRTDRRVIVLIKDANEVYSFLYTADRADEVLRQFGRFACNPDLSFTWGDAANLSMRVRAAIGKEM